MRIQRNHKPEKLGSVIAALPQGREMTSATESFVYGFKRKVQTSGVVARIPVELNVEDDCQKPQCYFSGKALQLARGESSEEFLTVPVTKDGVKTLEAEFAVHDIDPNEGIPTVPGLNECFPEAVPEEMIGVNVAALQKAAGAIGASTVALCLMEDGRILVRAVEDVDAHRAPEAVLPKISIARQETLDFEKEGE